MADTSLPKGLRDIYSVFNTVSLNAALARRVTVALTLRAIADMFQYENHRLAERFREMEREVRGGA